MPRKARIFSREFKVSVIRRMLAGENVSAIALELQVRRKDLLVWRDRFRAGGAEALRGRGRSPKRGLEMHLDVGLALARNREVVQRNRDRAQLSPAVSESSRNYASIVIVLPGSSSGIRPVKTSLPTEIQPSVAEKLGRAICRNIALHAPAMTGSML